MTIDDLIVEIERLDAEATKGPWKHGCDPICGKPVVFQRLSGYEAPETIDHEAVANLVFLDKARTLLPLCGRILKAVETHMQISSCACPNWFKKELAKILEVQND